MQSRSILFQCISAAVLICPTAYSKDNAAPDIEPRVKTTLQKMVNYLEAMDNFSFKACASTEDVSSTLQKLQFDTSLEGVIQRPNKAYFKKSGNEQMSLWFDGQTATVLDRKANKYAKITINGDIQDLVAKLDELGVETPFAGLLNRSILKHVDDHVFKGDYYGLAEIDGTTTEHLAFRQDSSDWQLWTDEKSGAPKKVVITSKMLAGAPEHILMIKEAVNNQPKIEAAVFQAQIPDGAIEIPFRAGGSDAINNSNW
jgi:hypothetical protein